MSQFGNMATD